MKIKSLAELIGQDSSKKASASLVAAEPDALVVAVTETERPGKIVTRTLRLSGRWRLTSQNALEFALDKDQERRGVVSFGADWRVNGANRLEILAGRDKLALDGSWDISDKNRLSYRVGRDADSTLHFRGSFGTKSVLAKKGEIRYELGVEADQRRKSSAITLFGKWKLSRDLGLDFEVRSGGVKSTISFGAEYTLGRGGQVFVDLKSRQGKPLGVELILTQDVFGKDGQVFVRLQKSLEESRAEAGMRIRF